MVERKNIFRGNVADDTAALQGVFSLEDITNLQKIAIMAKQQLNFCIGGGGGGGGSTAGGGGAVDIEQEQ